MKVGLLNEIYFSHTKNGFIYTNLLFKNGQEQKIRWNFGQPHDRWSGSCIWYVMSGKGFFFNQLNKEQQLFLRKKVVDWLARYKDPKNKCGFHMGIVEDNGTRKMVPLCWKKNRRFFIQNLRFLF